MGKGKKRREAERERARRAGGRGAGVTGAVTEAERTQTSLAAPQGVRQALPAAFCARMKKLLGEKECAQLLASYDAPPVRALRSNPLKLTAQALAALAPWPLFPVPWAATGFYYEERGEGAAARRPGKHPYHEAGLYYMQEPSAMAVAALSGARPGERVLDLCAAPGGKTTQLAGMMRDEGLLVSNEIHPARAKILSQNVERMGIACAVVMNETPERLAGRFPAFFDRVIVDAPCSGEGMFRKEEQATLQWSEENVALCAKRQQAILDEADRMLCDGGTLVYSTCTFAPQEDEGAVWEFLQRHPQYEVVDARAEVQTERTEAADDTPAEEIFGQSGADRRADYAALSCGNPAWREADGAAEDGGTLKDSVTAANGAAKNSGADAHNPQELSRTVRLWPHRLRGEGHFVAVLKKAGQTGRKLCADPLPPADRTALALWEQFAAETLTEKPAGIPALFGEALYLLPAAVSLDRLKVLRAGLHVGAVKKGRFEPSHALALALRADAVKSALRLTLYERTENDAQETVRNTVQDDSRQEQSARNTMQNNSGQEQPARDAAQGNILREAAGMTEAIRFLKGETLPCPQTLRGWALVLADGYPLGWGKASGGVLKNHYPKGLRWQG